MNAIALRIPRVLGGLVLACAVAIAGCGGSTAKNQNSGATCTSPGATCAVVSGPTAGTSAGTVQASPGTSATPPGTQPASPGTPSGTAGAAMTPPSSSAGAPATMPPPAGTTQPPTTTAPPPPAGSSGCGAATWPAAGDKMIDVGGMQREYISAIPSDYNSNTPYKLIFAWHGLGGSAKQVAGGFGYGYYGLQQLAGNTAIFVAGQGLDTGISIGANGMPMNGMGGTGGTPPAGSSAGWLNTNDQDIAFVKAMLDELRKSYCIDDKRIFSVGMSFGGIMSNTVGCELGGVFRAIAPMSGSGPRVGFGGSASCMGQVAVWIAHGNMDMTVPFSSGQASRDYWVKANHCTTDTMAVDPMGCLLYQGCDAGFPVTFCEFSGGHTIWQPSTQAIWKFFSQF